MDQASPGWPTTLIDIAIAGYISATGRIVRLGMSTARRTPIGIPEDGGLAEHVDASKMLSVDLPIHQRIAHTIACTSDALEENEIGTMPGSRKSKRVLETRFSIWMCQNLKVAGAMVLNVHGHQMQSPGWPDIQVYHRIWSGHIELKMEPEEPSDLQDTRLRGLILRGTPACWMDCSQEGAIRIWLLAYSSDSKSREWTVHATPFRRVSRKTDSGAELLHLLSRHVTI